MKKMDNIAKSYKRLTFTFVRYQEKERLFIESTLEKYLDSIGRSEMSNRLCYCLHELASNACKANSKRIYFIENKLDISKPEEYKTGILKFKESMIKKKNYYFSQREKKNLYIKFQIKRDSKNLYISIINNVPLTIEEINNIANKFEISDKYETMLDAMDDLHDIQEGAGLGIFTILMMFKEMGIGRENLNLFTRGNETHTTTTIAYT